MCGTALPLSVSGLLLLDLLFLFLRLSLLILLRLFLILIFNGLSLQFSSTLCAIFPLLSKLRLHDDDVWMFVAVLLILGTVKSPGGALDAFTAVPLEVNRRISYQGSDKWLTS